MKKILILPILIAPIVAHATDPVGPSGTTPSNAVIATYRPYYQTAEILPSDTTQVVSASYVKGAYNDTIAAINKIHQNKQEVLTVYDYKVDRYETIDTTLITDLDEVSAPTELVNGMAVKNAIDSVNSTISGKRVSAVTTWGNDTPPQLQLSNIQ